MIRVSSVQGAKVDALCTLTFLVGQTFEGGEGLLFSGNGRVFGFVKGTGDRQEPSTHHQSDALVRSRPDFQAR